MKYNPATHHRRSIRLKNYDYSQGGAYFITILTKDRKNLFGKVVDGEMKPNEFGDILTECWHWLVKHHVYVDLDEWVLMSNHLHGIIVIQDGLGRGGSRTALTPLAPAIPSTTKRKPLGRLVGAFKTVSTRRINELRRTEGFTVWHRNYYEHIIRSEKAMNRIREYIFSNPLRWEFDRENPKGQIDKMEKEFWKGVGQAPP